jgi:hypothetical protein
MHQEPIFPLLKGPGGMPVLQMALSSGIKKDLTTHSKSNQQAGPCRSIQVDLFTSPLDGFDHLAFQKPPLRVTSSPAMA